jgi:nuclear receptor subfamily 1 group I
VSIEPNSIESILCEAIKLEFEAYSSIAQCHSNSRELNDAERAKLNELIVANKALLSPLDDELNNLIGSDYKFRSLLQGNPQQALETDPALVDVINLTAIVIRRLIKMAKKINAFKNMCQEDQVALLKGGCTEIMLLRSAMNYDPTKQTWKVNELPWRVRVLMGFVADPAQPGDV